MKCVLKAPGIDHFVDVLSNRYGNAYTYDETTQSIINEIFQYLHTVTPVLQNDVYELWITAERGTLEDYGDYEELLACGEVDSYSEFESLWQEEYPSETVVYRLRVVANPSVGYMELLINHRMVIEVDPRKERCSFLDISDFSAWLLSEVKRCCALVENGTYNAYADSIVPYEKRTGTIRRSVYWEIFPVERTQFFENISQTEIDEFIRCINENAPVTAIPEMTADTFYQCCALGYAAMGYACSGMTPKELYLKYADGRDDGLTEIDSDSAEAFSNWYHDRDKIGHPWEVCRGGNSTHISLYVYTNENGFYFSLSGSVESRCIETVKFYLALRCAGYPVKIHEGEQLVQRFLGNEKIGIAPDDVAPCYCHSYFPEEHIIDFMNLPFEKREEVIASAEWQPLPKVYLMKKERRIIL